jgi:hypothetical protein
MQRHPKYKITLASVTEQLPQMSSATEPETRDSRLRFKPIENVERLSKGRITNLISHSFPHIDSTLYVLDGDVDGFGATYFNTRDFVGVAVMLPRSTQTETEAISTLIQALETILTLSIGNLLPVHKTRVLLFLADIDKYFGGRQEPNLTPMLTALMNDRAVKTDAASNYTGTTSEDGMYLFELPSSEAITDTDSVCGKYVKVDLNHPYMKTLKAKQFLTRLSFDLSICRGEQHLHENISKGLAEDSVLYLVFRNKVSADSEWWTDTNNVAHICAAVWAEIRLDDGSMYLAAICSRPGTTGTVARMLENISADAKSAYGLNRLLLRPASESLRNIYQRPQYGFHTCRDEDSEDYNYMVKYLTHSSTRRKAMKTAELAAEAVSPSMAREPFETKKVEAAAKYVDEFYPSVREKQPGFSPYAPAVPYTRGKDLSRLPAPKVFTDEESDEEEFDWNKLQKRARTNTHEMGGKKNGTRRESNVFF